MPALGVENRLTSGLAAITLIAALALPGAAAAQAPPTRQTATISARAYATMPPGGEIEIRIDASDDTDQAHRLEPVIAAALEARGFRVVKHAPLVLEFYSTEPYGVSTGNGPPWRGADSRLQPQPVGPAAGSIGRTASPQRFSSGVVSDLETDLFGTKSNGTTPPRNQQTGHAVHVTMSVNYQPTAQRVWQGSIGTMTYQPDSYAVVRSMVPALVDKVGYDADQVVVNLPPAVPSASAPSE